MLEAASRGETAAMLPVAEELMEVIRPVVCKCYSDHWKLCQPASIYASTRTDLTYGMP